MESSDLFRTKSVWSLIARMSIPALVSILVMLLYNMTDMYFVARTGDDAQVAAVSLVMPVFTVLMAISTMLGNGACTLIAQALGGEDRERARTCSSLCVWGCAGFGLAFALLCFVFCGPLLDFLGANEDMRIYARLYLLVLAAGAPVILLNHSLGSVIRGEGAAKQGMVGGLVSTVTNIVLDPIFISGFRLGVGGAAVATVLGNLAGTVYFLLYKKRRPSILTLDIQYARKNVPLLGSILALGLPNAVSSTLSGFAATFSNRLLVAYSTGAVAAMGAAGKVTMLITMVQMGVCMGVQPLMAYCHGAKDHARMVETLKKLALLTAVLGLALGAVSFLARGWIVGLFLSDVELRALASHIVTITICSAPFMGFFYLGMNYLQASGKALLATLVSALRQGVLLIPLLYLMEAMFQLDGPPLAHVVADLSSILISVGCALWFLRREGNSAPPASATDGAELPSPPETSG